MKNGLRYDNLGNELQTYEAKNQKYQNSKIAKIPYPLRISVIILLFFLGLYFLISPFIPEINYFFFGKNPVIPYQSKIAELVLGEGEKAQQNSEKVIPAGRRIVIPKIQVDMPIVDGPDEDSLLYGVWRRPLTGTINSGNMVLTGHRLGPGFLPSEIMKTSSFYNLDKVNVGDYIIIYWDGVEYDYQIYEAEEVPDTAVEIESPSKDHRLTLYTCTPIGINNRRLVRYAKPVDLNSTAQQESEKKEDSEN